MGRAATQRLLPGRDKTTLPPCTTRLPLPLPHKACMWTLPAGRTGTCLMNPLQPFPFFPSPWRARARKRPSLTPGTLPYLRGGGTFLDCCEADRKNSSVSITSPLLTITFWEEGRRRTALLKHHLPSPSPHNLPLPCSPPPSFGTLKLQPLVLLTAHCMQ